MRFNIKPKKIKVKTKPTKPPHKAWKIGDTKIETKFAYFPTKINKKIRVWLEKYELHYEFKETKYRIELPMSGICGEDGRVMFAI